MGRKFINYATNTTVTSSTKFIAVLKVTAISNQDKIHFSFKETIFKFSLISSFTNLLVNQLVLWHVNNYWVIWCTDSDGLWLPIEVLLDLVIWVQIQDKPVCISLYANALGKNMNPSGLPSYNWFDFFWLMAYQPLWVI